MKHVLKSVFLFFVVFSTTAVSAQLELPQPSPQAKVSYKLGMTNIEIDYCSPGVKGRTIWGELEPYGEVWRTGANASTKITFDKELTVGRQKLKAGTYALYTIPNKEEWTVILSNNTELWGADGYEEKDDATRFTVNPQKTSEFVERLRFLISEDPKDRNNGIITLQWENLQISFNVKTDIKEQAEAAIQEKLDESKRTWRYLMQAASFYQEMGDLDKALETINQSIDMNEYYYNYYLKGMILAEKEDYNGAMAAADKALEIGPKLPEDLRKRFENYKENIEASRTEWSKK